MSARPSTAPPLTAEEAAGLASCWLGAGGVEHRWELVAGRIVELSPVKKRHGRILARLTRRLEEVVERERLGEIYAGDVGFILRRNPDTVRAPDLAFVQTARLPAPLPTDDDEGFSEVAPDLVVEILSPSDEWPDVERKVSEYLVAGVQVVWLVDPADNEVQVRRAGCASVRLGKGDTLVDSALLPSLRLDLSEILG